MKDIACFYLLVNLGPVNENVTIEKSLIT